MRIAFCLEEERGALRLFLRALRRLPLEPRLGGRRLARRARAELRIAQRLRERVRAVARRARRPPEAADRGRRRRSASRPAGPRPAPGLVRKALAAGSRPGRLAARALRGADSATASAGCCSRPATRSRSPASSSGCSREPALRARAGARAAAGAVRDWGAVADQVEEIYAADRARRHDPRGNPRAPPPARRAGAQIHVDLHMHTDHSPDCATPVEVLLATAREPRPRGDRDHRPQRDLGRARGARDRRADGRDQGDRRRGGEDRRAGRGDRALPRARRSSAG